MVDGQPGSRPIDALLANLNELYRQLVLAAANPAKPSRRSSRWTFRWRACERTSSRLPQPLAGMIDKVAKDAAGDATASSIAQIAEAMAQDVTGPCQQIIANRYPFAKSDRDVPLADFAKLFAPGGVIEKFFAANLDPLVNRTGKTWVWKPNPNLRASSPKRPCASSSRPPRSATRFSRPAATSPNMTFEVKPLTLSGDAQTATLAINGANVVAQQGAPFAAGERRNGRAPAQAKRRSRWRRTCRIVSPTGAHGRLGAVSSHRRRLFDPERQCGQGQLRRRSVAKSRISSPHRRSTIP